MTIASEQIVGYWNIVSWKQSYDDGREAYPLGQELCGFIHYDANGRMVCMMNAADRPAFVTGGQWNADDAEKARAYNSALFYSGVWHLDGDTVIHAVDTSLFPNWVGTQQKRAARIDGDSLYLSARIEEGTSQARSAILEWSRSR